MTYAVDIETEATAHTAATSGFAPGVSNGPRGRRSRVPLFVPGDQLYYWSFAWQDSERKAMEDLRAGRARTFDDPMAAARYLLGSDR